MTTKEVAAWLRVHPNRVYEQVQRSRLHGIEIPAIQIGRGEQRQQLRWRRDEIFSWWREVQSNGVLTRSLPTSARKRVRRPRKRS